MNYLLKSRLSMLPKKVYKEIYDQFMTLPYGSAMRWKTIMEDTARDLRVQEAAIMIEHIGCTLSNLIDPDIDLLMIWQEEKYLKKEKELGKEFGISLH